MEKTESVKRKIETIKHVVERKRATYDERKAKALSEGHKTSYVVCPLCLRSRPLRTHKSGKTIFRIDPNPEVIQVRYGIGGRAQGGFFKNDSESMRLEDIKNTDSDVYENLKEEIAKLYKMFCESK